MGLAWADPPPDPGVKVEIWNGGSDYDEGEGGPQQGSAVAEEDKIDPGGWMVVNSDDDDGNGQSDLGQTGPVSDEDNLAKVRFSVANPVGGLAEALALQCGGFNVYTDSQKTSEYDISTATVEDLPITVWLEPTHTGESQVSIMYWGTSPEDAFLDYARFYVEAPINLEFSVPGMVYPGPSIRFKTVEPSIGTTPKIGVLYAPMLFRSAPDMENSWSGLANSGGVNAFVTQTPPQGYSTIAVTRGSGLSETATVLRMAPPTGPNENEWASDPTHLVYLPLLGSLVYQADLWSMNLYGSNHNTKGDAAKHAYWNLLMAKYLGMPIAIEVAMAHEVTGLQGGSPHNEIVMDLFNNMYAQTKLWARASPNPPDYELEDIVTQAIDAGELYYLDDPANYQGEGLLIWTNE